MSFGGGMNTRGGLGQAEWRVGPHLGGPSTVTLTLRQHVDTACASMSNYL
jgi:hypothetical protein